MAIKKGVAKKKVTGNKKVISKKKVATKKRTVTKKFSRSVELTKAHQKAIVIQEKVEASFSKAKDSLDAAMQKVKSAKTTAVKNNAKNRVVSWREKILTINAQIKSAKADVSEHEKTARELLAMNSARDKAVAFFIKKWDKDYLKKMEQKKRTIAARAKATAKKRKENANKTKLASNKPDKTSP